jgi:hypothetical protein
MWNNLFKKTKSTQKPLEPVEKHNHSWILVAHTYARPRKDISLDGMAQETAEKLMFGVTTLSWACECGDSKQEYLLGSDQNTLDEVLDKVVEFGQQIVDRDGQKYLVTKWATQAPLSAIPIR